MSRTDYGAILKTVLEDTADAIREVNGTNALIAPNAFSENISTMHTDTEIENALAQLVEETETGAIASITDGADGIQTKEIVVNIDKTSTECNISNGTTAPVTDTAPYLFRQSGGDNNAYVGTEETDKLVGASAVVNQLAKTIKIGNYNTGYSYNSSLSYSNGVVTSTAVDGVDIRTAIGFVQGHKYVIGAELKLSISSNINVRLLSPTQAIKTLSLTANSTYLYADIITVSGSNSNIQFMGRTSEGDTLSLSNFVVSDLTAMFGTAIADYVYSLEQATAGSGIAYLRKYGFFTKDYYHYKVNTLQSVNTSKHVMVGFNQWDEQWEVGGYNTQTGEKTIVTNRIRSKGKISVIPNSTIYCVTANIPMRLFLYDANGNYITTPSTIKDTSYTIPNNVYYICFQMGVDYGITYNNNICINISNASKDGTYEPYSKHEYALPNVDLRGLYKLDANHNLYADGDTLEGDGTLTRKYEQRPYQSGDESLTDAITDGTNTVVKLATPTTEQVTGFTNPQIVSKDGTEEYVDNRDMPLPVGHSTLYHPATRTTYSIPFGQSASGELHIVEGQNDSIVSSGTTITLSSKTVISTRLGDNHFYADTGDVSVTYRANGELYVQQHST